MTSSCAGPCFGSACPTTERSKRRARLPNRSPEPPSDASRARCSEDKLLRLLAASKRAIALVAAFSLSLRWTSMISEGMPPMTLGGTIGSYTKATPQICASNASAIDIAYSAAGSRVTPRLRLTTRSLIMGAPSAFHRRAAGPAYPSVSVTPCVPALTWIRRRLPTLALAAVGLELLEVAPEVAGFLLVLDAGEDHLGARHFGTRILDVALEGLLAPDDAGILVRIAVVEPLDRAGLAAGKAVEHGTDLVLGIVTDVMAGHAFLERCLPGRGILSQRRPRRCGQCHGRECQTPHLDLLRFRQSLSWTRAVA